MIVLPLGIEGGVLGQINSRTIRIGVASTIGYGVPALEVVALASEGVCIQCGIRLCIYGLRGHRAFDRVFRTAVGFKGDGQLDRLFAAPDAVDIVNGLASLGVLRLGVRAVGVVQLGGGDGDGHRLIAICIILMGCGRRAGCALLNVLAGAIAGADICAALGSVDGANSRYAAVHIHLRINQVVIGAVVCLTRRIGHGLKLAGTPDEVVGVPLIAVIEIDVLSVCNRQASALGNIDLNARQQSRILIDRHISRLDIDSNVVGDGKHIFCRVDLHARKSQLQHIQCRLTVYRKDKAVCLFIVVLSEAAGRYVEHAVLTNEVNRSGIGSFHCVNAAVNFLVSASIQGQRHFNILHEILREGEYVFAHVGGRAAAAEVCNLIEFIHRSAGFRQNRTAAGDKAPCIEITAALDCNGAVICHFDIAVITNRAALLTAASSKIPAAQADSAIDGNGRAFAHRQRPESLRRRSRPNRRRSIRVQRPCRVEGDQQRDARWNGIGTADGAISSQGDLGLAVCLCIGNRIAQIVKPLTASLKKRQRLAHKLRCDGAVIFNVQGCDCRSRDAFACGQVIPAHELITSCRSGHHLIGRHRTLGIAILLGNRLAVHGVGTIFGRHKGSSRRYVRDQRYIGHGNFCSCRAARLNINRDGTTRSKLLAETAACGNGSSIDLNHAAVLLDGIIKGQCSLCCLVVFDGQCGCIGCIAACSTRVGSCAGNARTIGRPSIICVACKTQSNVLVS